MITRVLFVDSDASALARIKKAVEQAGNYEVKVFVTGRAALEYATQKPPDLAVISLNIQDISPNALAQTLRGIRPELPLLLRAPTDTDEKIIRALNPTGVLHGGYTARLLLPMVEDALNFNPPPEEPEEPPSQKMPFKAKDPLGGDMAAFGEVLESLQPAPPPERDDTFKTLVDSLRAPVEKPSLIHRRENLANWASAPLDASDDFEVTDEPDREPENVQLFDRLAAEEPPSPTLEDSGTVGDLIAVTDFKEQDDVQVVDIPDEMIQDISELALDNDEHELLQALSTSSSEAPVADSQAINDRHPTQPEAAQTGETTPDIRRLQAVPLVEPVPLAEKPSPPTRRNPNVSSETNPATLALQLTQHTLKSAAQATFLMRDNEVMTSAGALPERDITELASIIDTDMVLADNTTKIKFASLQEAHLNFMIVAAPTVDSMVLVIVFPENMHLRIIRSQTRAMLEALVTIKETPAGPPVDDLPGALPEDSTGVSSVFETPFPDASEEVFTVDAEPEEAAYGVTGKIEVAEAEPISAAVASSAEGLQEDQREATEARPAVDPATLTKYAFAWILRNPDDELDDGLMNALHGWLDEIIISHHWLSEEVSIQPDYISVVISILPVETPSEVVQCLMNETANRICVARPEFITPEALWADASYVVTPGRPLTGEELSRFISYQREM